MVKQGPSEDDRAPQGGGLPAHRAPLVAYAQAWDSPLVALALTDLDGVLVAASATFRDRAGLPARPEGTPLAELAPPLASVRELLREGRVEPAPQQGVLLRPDGRDELMCTVHLVSQPDGSPGWFLIHLPEGGILALHDSLTGLPNRTLLLDRLAQAQRRRSRTGTSVEVVVVDLDGFKQVNDELGHLAGDSVLVEVARRLLSLVRPGDTVARWGATSSYSSSRPRPGSAGKPSARASRPCWRHRCAWTTPPSASRRAAVGRAQGPTSAGSTCCVEPTWRCTR